ncbi:hypothetical protein H5410_010610 [Solanum commersonii]|uniref:BZIP domain-containing protein n=1 Tax=Solanum commersonii TaxID=4109 RepID=A0A9J6AL69_SOLCO|nr:hypothetical protein H5410_010610 [Solanum commersonii]
MDLNFTCKKEDKELDRLIMDDQLDKLYQAFNNYKKKKSIDDVDPKDFMDNYFAQNNYDYLHYDAQSSIMQISRDFEVFESRELPSTTKTSIDFNNNMDQLEENVDEFEKMIEEMNSSNVHPSNNPFGCYSNVYEGDGMENYDTTQSSTSNDFERRKLTPATKTSNIDQLGEDVGESPERMIEEMVSQYTSISNANHDSSSPVIRYFFCGQTKANNHRRKRQKRKYRGVVMSEEQRLLKMAKQKIKNREVAARTHEMRLAREAYLESQHLELLMENDFLKKMVMFLEDHKRVNVPPEPLRRTISGPMLIQ